MTAVKTQAMKNCNIINKNKNGIYKIVVECQIYIHNIAHLPQTLKCNCILMFTRPGLRWYHRVQLFKDTNYISLPDTG